MRVFIAVVLGAAAIATAQASQAVRGSDSSLESRQGIADTLSFQTLPQLQAPIQQLLLSRQNPYSPLQQQLSLNPGIQLGAQGLPVQLAQALNRQGLPSQLYGQGLPYAQLQGLGQGFPSAQLQGLGQGIPGAQLQGLGQGFPSAQLQGLGQGFPGLSRQRLQIAQLQNLRRQGLAGSQIGLNRLVGLGNSFGGLGAQEQLTRGVGENQRVGLGVNPLLGRRAGKQESLTDLIQLANILGEDDLHSASSSPPRTQGNDRYPNARFTQTYDDSEDDELTLLLHTLSSLRSLPPSSRYQPVDAAPSFPPHFPSPIAAGAGLTAGVFPGLTHRAGLGDGESSGSPSVPASSHGRLDQFYSPSVSATKDYDDQFRFPNTR